MWAQIFLFFLMICGGVQAECGSVLGIGYTPVDLLIDVEEGFIESIGCVKGGAHVVGWETFSQLPKERKIASGGCAANAVKGLAKLGVRTSFLGKVGRDEKGTFFARRLVDHGVQPALIAVDTPTGQIACLITPDGQRTMLIFLGSGQELTESDLLPEQFSGFQLLHIDGYTLWNQNLFTEALKMAKAHGMIVSVDLGCTEIMRSYREVILSVAPSCIDIIFGNEEEIEALTGESVLEGLADLSKLCPIVVAKVGKEGCWVAAKKTLFHSPGIVVESVIDTTGAGDLFASGFLYGYLKGLPLQACAASGNFLGSIAVQQYGAEFHENQ